MKSKFNVDITGKEILELADTAARDPMNLYILAMEMEAGNFRDWFRWKIRKLPEDKKKFLRKAIASSLTLWDPEKKY